MTEKKIDRKILLENIKTFAITFLIIMLIKMFLVDVTRVSGASMNDTLETNDLLVVDKVSPNYNKYSRGDIVIVKAPYEENKLYVKRVIGLPNEEIDLIDGDFYIDGERLDESYTNVDYTYEDVYALENHWVLGDSEYFIVGDNRIKGLSHDSRAFGAVDERFFLGKARFRIFPFSKVGELD